MSEKAENDHTGEKQPEPSIQSIILAVDCEEIIATGIRPHPDYFPAVGYSPFYDRIAFSESGWNRVVQQANQVNVGRV